MTPESMPQRVRNAVGQLGASSTFRAISGLAGGSMLATVLGVVGSLIQARFVSPSDLGYFRSFGIVTGYSAFLSLGLFAAVHRLYPYYVGKGQRERGIATAEICQAYSLAVTAIVGSVFLALSLRAALLGDWRAMLGWLVQAIVIAGFIYGGYLGATFRSGHEFATVAKGSVLAAFAGFATLPFFLIWPYIALVLRNSASTLVELIYLHVRRPLRLRWRFNWREWGTLVREGFPMFIAGYGLSTFWNVVESSLVLRFIGTEGLGFWSVSLMLVEAANKVPQAITSVYTPRLIETFGRTESLVACLRQGRKPMVLGIVVTALMVVCGWLLLPFVVPILMPKYAGAIPTMRLMLLVLPLILLVELPYALLIAMGKTRQQNLSVYAGLACFVLLALGANRLGMGLNGVVVASLLGRTLRMVFTYMFIALAAKPHSH